MNRALIIAGWLVLAATAGAQPWIELGDAQNFPDGTAQITQGVFMQTLSGTTNFAAGDLRDAYCIDIWFPAGFVATTDPIINPSASGDFDTRLFLFRPDGEPVLANDDTPGAPGSLSLLSRTAGDGSGFVLSQPGEYVLVIGGFPDDPRDTSDTDLFDIGTEYELIHAANPAAGIFDHWEDAPTTGTGSYTVAFNGVRPCQGDLDAVFGNEGQSDRVCGGDTRGNLKCGDIASDEFGSYDTALGHVNGDGELDLVLSAFGLYYVCLGNGLENFTSCSSTETPANFNPGVALGFVDGDQSLDAVFASYNARNRVCLGNGLGTFSCSDVTTDAFASNRVALGYVDGDRNLDAVFANFAQRNRVCLGDGQGGFTCSDVSTDAFVSRDVALGDMNGDQRLDAVFANSSAKNRVCYGDGTGGFSQCSDPFNDLSAETRGVALGDLNGDQKLDAVFAELFGPDTVCLNGDPFDPDDHNLYCGGVPNGTYDSQDVALGYVDQDQKLDFVFANHNQPNRVCVDFDPATYALSCSDVSANTDSSDSVALGELGVTRLIFNDGFDSGNTSRWSSQQPPP